MRIYKILIKMSLMGIVGLVIGTPLMASSQQNDTKKPTAQSATIAGPDGVAQELKNAESATSTYPQLAWLQPYDAWKKKIKSDYGVSFGLSAYWPPNSPWILCDSLILPIRR